MAWAANEPITPRPRAGRDVWRLRVGLAMDAGMRLLVQHLKPLHLVEDVVPGRLDVRKWQVVCLKLQSFACHGPTGSGVEPPQ